MSLPTDNFTNLNGPVPEQYRPPMAQTITPAAPRRHRGAPGVPDTSTVLVIVLALIAVLALTGAAFLKNDLDGTRSDLARTKSDLAGTKTELAAAKAENVRSQAEIDDLEGDLANAKSDTEAAAEARDDATLCAETLWKLSNELTDEDYSSALDTIDDLDGDCMSTLGNDNGELRSV